MDIYIIGTLVFVGTLLLLSATASLFADLGKWFASKGADLQQWAEKERRKQEFAKAQKQLMLDSEPIEIREAKQKALTEEREQAMREAQNKLNVVKQNDHANAKSPTVTAATQCDISGQQIIQAIDTTYKVVRIADILGAFEEE